MPTTAVQEKEEMVVISLGVTYTGAATAGTGESGGGGK